MRVIAGEFRGRVLQAPKGNATRPTTDRVREALMSSLVSIRGSLEDAIVGDLFAGSGALGIEALSRGAAKAIFFEKDAGASRLLKKNLSTLGLGSEQVAVYQADATKELHRMGDIAIDLLFLDPPYAFKPEELLELCTFLRSRALLEPGAIIVYEHANSCEREVLEVFEAAGERCVLRKRYGDTSITVFQNRENEQGS